LVFFLTAFCLTAYWASAAFPEQPLPSSGPRQASHLRVAAEWEPVIGVLIGWPFKLPKALVLEMARDVDLYVTVSDCKHQERARQELQCWGIEPQRVRFIVTPQGTGYYITRDWGPYAVFDEQGSYHLVDGRFLDYPLGSVSCNRLIWLHRMLGLNYRREDQAPAAVAREMGYPRTELPFALTGGNITFDGQGTAFATQIMLDENRAKGVSRELLLAIARDGLGVQQFHFVPNFERLGIQHVDCLFKLLDEERILVKRPPPDHPLYANIERVVCHLSRLTNVYGRPYQILRIDTAPYFLHKLANYTNSVIVNHKIYVPLFGIPADEAALETWRQAMPGYEVFGFHHSGWSFTDAEHCRVRGIWDPKMLHLTHRRPDAVVPSAGRITLEAEVGDYSGAGLVEGRALLAWRTRGSAEWQAVPLHLAGRPHAYQATIEPLQPGQAVEYYFTAASHSGRQETLPRTAPKAIYTFTVGQEP
jgi:agmatine/peptidylarginine deiminase